MIGRFSLFILFDSSIRSLSLATLHLLSFEPVTFFILHECIALPPTLFQICSFICSCLSIARYCLCFHLFPGGREAYKDRTRCFRCFKLGHWARDCTSTWSSPRNVYRGTGLAPATITAPTSPARECNTTPVLNSEVFEEEVSDIAQVHCENDLFEFELTDHPPLVNVKGNLRRKLEFWKRIGTSKFILNVIERGYMLPFLSLPEPAVFRNNRSSLAHATFVEDAIRELVESGRVLEVVLPPLVVNPSSVSVQATGKKRLILDLRYVIKCLRKIRVKYEDWKIALSYFMTEAFMFSFDLKSGYHHIEIFEGSMAAIDNRNVLAYHLNRLNLHLNSSGSKVLGSNLCRYLRRTNLPPSGQELTTKLAMGFRKDHFRVRELLNHTTMWTNYLSRVREMTNY